TSICCTGAARTRSPRPWPGSNDCSATARSAITGSAISTATTWRNGGGAAVASNQVLYNLTRRGPEFDLIPWCRERNISIMAYSPIEQGRMLGHKALADVGARRGAPPAQVAL